MVYPNLNKIRLVLFTRRYKIADVSLYSLRGSSLQPVHFAFAYPGQPQKWHSMLADSALKASHILLYANCYSCMGEGGVESSRHFFLNHPTEVEHLATHTLSESCKVTEIDISRPTLFW